MLDLDCSPKHESFTEYNVCMKSITSVVFIPAVANGIFPTAAAEHEKYFFFFFVKMSPEIQCICYNGLHWPKSVLKCEKEYEGAATVSC